MYNVFKRIKEKFKDYSELKIVFYKFCGEIYIFVGNCVNNVKVIIYIDEVFDDLIEICVGVGENDFIIIIDKDVNVIYSWMREIWGKVLCDVWNKVKDIIECIIGFIVFKVGILILLVISVFFVFVL